jgi:hypothetical protein
MDQMGGHEYRMCLDRFPEQDSKESIRENLFFPPENRERDRRTNYVRFEFITVVDSVGYDAT